MEAIPKFDIIKQSAWILKKNWWDKNMIKFCSLSLVQKQLFNIAKNLEHAILFQINSVI